MTYEEIMARKAEIRSLIANASNAELDSFNKELDNLNKQERALKEAAEKRQKLLNSIAQNANNLEEIDKEKKEERKMENENILNTKEYRSAYLKNLQNKELTKEEKRAMSTAQASVGSVVPNSTQDLIIEKVFEQAPLLNEITLLRVEGGVTFSIESTNADAVNHVEGATLTEDGDVLIPVTLGAYEINKYITISKSVSKMSVAAFEIWLVKMLGKMIARKITKLIINGTGSSQVKGIEKTATWDSTNSITVAAASTTTKQNVLDLIALLPGGYDANAKFLMSKKTLLKDLRTLQNKSADDFYVKENGKYYIEGYEVMLDESVTQHEMYLGDFTTYVGNLAEDINVDTDKKLSSNSFEYLGSAMFDGKPADSTAFVKLVKTVANAG